MTLIIILNKYIIIYILNILAWDIINFITIIKTNNNKKIYSL